MLRILAAAALLALVYGQDTTTTAPHTHHTHPPFIEHTFDVSGATFFQDFDFHVMVLKTTSGCYVAHVTDTQIKNAEDPEKLLHLEGAIIHHVRTAKHFNVAANGAHLKSEIQTACPQLLHYHH